MTTRFDPDDYDFDRPILDAVALEARNPQSGPMRQLDGIVRLSDEPPHAVGYKDVRADEFWVPHHFPGRPMLPGVLMVEAAAQLSSLLRQQREASTLQVLGKVEGARFLRPVVPGERLVLFAVVEYAGRRGTTCFVQGMVGSTRSFETRVFAVPAAT